MNRNENNHPLQDLTPQSKGGREFIHKNYEMIDFNVYDRSICISAWVISTFQIFIFKRKVNRDLMPVESD